MLIPPGRRRKFDPSKDTQFSDAWILLAILLSLVALALDSVFLTTAAVLLVGVAGLSWLWSRFSHHGLSYHRRFSETRAFLGEFVDLTLEIRNAKPLPLPWVTVRDLFPSELSIGETMLEINPTTNLAEFSTFWMVGPFQHVTRRFTLHCTTRGFHRYGPARLTTGDAFGFFVRTREETNIQYLIVYPRLYLVDELRLPTKNPFGDVRVSGSLFEDPLRTAGIREWRTADPMRRVHWKATARRQQLLSRVYEPSEEQVVQIFLNVATLERHWHGYIPELQERAISVAGSLALLASSQRLPVGLVANGVLPGGDQALRLLPGRSPKQLVHILEMLAAVTPFATETIERMILREAPHLPWGATLVVVTAIAHDGLLAALLDLAAVGRRVVLFTLAEQPPRRWLHTIQVYHLPHLVEDLIAPVRVGTGQPVG